MEEKMMKMLGWPVVGPLLSILVCALILMSFLGSHVVTLIWATIFHTPRKEVRNGNVR